MNSSQKLIVLLFASMLQWPTMVKAQAFNFPSFGSRSSQESIATQDGTVCTQNVNGRVSLNVGVFGEQQSNNTNVLSFNAQKGENFGGFAMLNVPLNAPPRLDCAKLLEIEYERAKMRLNQEKLEMLAPTEQDTLNPLYQSP